MLYIVYIVVLYIINIYAIEKMLEFELVSKKYTGQEGKSEQDAPANAEMSFAP